MNTTLFSDAPAPTASAAAAPLAGTSSNSSSQPNSPQRPPQDFSSDNVRHLLFGTPEAVKRTIHTLHSRGYADPNDWSPAISTGRCNEVMRLLIKRVII